MLGCASPAPRRWEYKLRCSRLRLPQGRSGALVERGGHLCHNVPNRGEGAMPTVGGLRPDAKRDKGQLVK